MQNSPGETIFIISEFGSTVEQPKFFYSQNSTLLACVDLTMRWSSSEDVFSIIKLVLPRRIFLGVRYELENRTNPLFRILYGQNNLGHRTFLNLPIFLRVKSQHFSPLLTSPWGQKAPLEVRLLRMFFQLSN